MLLQDGSGDFIEDAGTSVYTQIRDHLIIPGAAPLVLGVFANDLLSFEVAPDKAQSLDFSESEDEMDGFYLNSSWITKPRPSHETRKAQHC